MASLQKEEQVLLRNFFILGIGFGFCFPIMALSIDFAVKGLSFSISNIVDIHLQNPIHFIIDTAPIILSLTSFLIGRYVIFRERKTKTHLELALKHSQKFYEYTTHLLEGNFDEMNMKDGESEEFKSLIALKERIMLSRQKESEALWVSNALEKISKVIRDNKSSKVGLCNQIIAKMATCLNANLGMFYTTLTDIPNNKIIAVAAYAQDPKVSLFTELEIGEGLVGQCFKEKKNIIITEIPDNYIQVNSGLGARKPDVLILAPLLFNDKAYGVLELACFEDITNYKIEFVNKAVEFIGYTLSMLDLSKTDFEAIPHNG